MNTPDTLTKDEAFYVEKLNEISDFVDHFEATATEMQRDCTEALQGSPRGVKYAKTLMSTRFVCRQDPLSIFESMLEADAVGDSFFALMAKPEAQPFVEAFCVEYVNRFAEPVVDAEVRK